MRVFSEEDIALLKLKSNASVSNVYIDAKSFDVRKKGRFEATRFLCWSVNQDQSIKMTRKRSNPDRVLTNAERCKRYRTKDIEAYRKEDALNKWYGRYKLASKNPAGNKKRLKDQAEKKRL